MTRLPLYYLFDDWFFYLSLYIVSWEIAASSSHSHVLLDDAVFWKPTKLVSFSLSNLCLHGLGEYQLPHVLLDDAVFWKPTKLVSFSLSNLCLHGLGGYQLPHPGC